MYYGLYDILGGITSPWRRTPWVVLCTIVLSIYALYGPILQSKAWSRTQKLARDELVVIWSKTNSGF